MEIDLPIKRAAWRYEVRGGNGTVLMDWMSPSRNVAISWHTSTGMLLASGVLTLDGDRFRGSCIVRMTGIIDHAVIAIDGESTIKWFGLRGELASNLGVIDFEIESKDLLASAAKPPESNEPELTWRQKPAMF